MKARDIEIGDQLFSPEGVACIIRELYYKTDEILVLSFDDNLGIHVHPERELLVARKGRVL